MTLTLPEELLLLRVAVGKTVFRPTSDFVSSSNRPLAAARLIELILAKRIAVTFRHGRLLTNDAVTLLDATPTGDPLLDDVLRRIATADAGSCSYWVKRTAKGAEVAYWDRLVETALLRPEPGSSRARRDGVHADTRAAITERIRSAITEPWRANLRDVTLATLVVHTQSLFSLLHRLQRNPAGLARNYMEHQRDERFALGALGSYKRFVASEPQLPEADRTWVESAAEGIEHLVSLVDDRPTGGGG